MTKRYCAPHLSVYGPIDDVTGVFGNPSSGDVAYDLSGDVIEADSLSVDGRPDGPPTLPPAPTPSP